MTRKLRAVHDAAATTAESRAAALQYVRMLTGLAAPHPDDAAQFEEIVLDLARATQRLEELVAARAATSAASSAAGLRRSAV